MAISGFKMLLVLAVVIGLFLPTFLKRASALGAVLPGLRDGLDGEGRGGVAGDPVAGGAADGSRAAGRDAGPTALRPGLAERFGEAAARLGHRLKGRRSA